MIGTTTDRIEKTLMLRAPRSRVWQALTDVDQFNTWFHVRLEGSFEAGARLRGAFTFEGHEHQIMDITVESMEPERLITWRWVPGNEQGVEQTTLVSFELEDAEGGTRLTMIESGFDALSPDKYEDAYRGNTAGWTTQIENLRHFLGENG
jgi:uncharacterized protein YndB with AHSA1/START domain